MKLPNFTTPSGSGLPSFGGRTVSQPVHLGGPHGTLELQPHDIIHGAVGGRGSVAQHWMSFPATAARDPIFWLHHAMIDRLWNRWLAQPGTQGNPVGNSVWMNTSFTFFDGNGAQVSIVVRTSWTPPIS